MAGTGPSMAAKVIDEDPNGINVHKTPGGKIIFTIPNNQRDGGLRNYIYLFNKEGPWFYVKLQNGIYGWMHSSVLGLRTSSINGDPCPLQRSPRDNSPVLVWPETDAILQILDLYYVQYPESERVEFPVWVKLSYIGRQRGKTVGWMPTDCSWDNP
jgi:hypothetical protein